MRRRKINVKRHLRTSPLGNTYIVRRHIRRIPLRRNDRRQKWNIEDFGTDIKDYQEWYDTIKDDIVEKKSKQSIDNDEEKEEVTEENKDYQSDNDQGVRRQQFRGDKFNERDRFSQNKKSDDNIAKSIKKILLASKKTNDYKLKANPKLARAKKVDKFFTSVSNKFPNLIGFEIEEGEQGYGKKRLMVVPIFAYSKEDLADPDIQSRILSDIEKFTTYMNNEFFSISKGICPSEDYSYYMGRLMNNFRPKNYEGEKFSKGTSPDTFYTFDFIVAQINDDGSIDPHTRANVVLIPEIDKKAHGKDRYVRRITGPQGEYWRRLLDYNKLYQYTLLYNEYKNALRSYNESLSFHDRKKASELAKKLSNYQRIVARYYLGKGLDVIPAQPYKIKKNVPHDYLGNKRPSGADILDLPDPHSFDIYEAQTGKRIDHRTMKKEASEKLNELTKMKLPEERGVPSFYVDPLHYYDNVEKNFDIRYPLGAYKYVKNKKGKWVRKNVGDILNSIPLKNRERIKKNIVWVDSKKLLSMSMINDPSVPLGKRQQEWNSLVKNAIRTNIAIKPDLKNLKILKKEPIAMSPSELKLVKELVEINIPPKPGKDMVYTPTPFMEKPLPKRKDKNERQMGTNRSKK